MVYGLFFSLWNLSVDQTNLLIILLKMVIIGKSFHNINRFFKIIGSSISMIYNAQILGFINFIIMLNRLYLA